MITADGWFDWMTRTPGPADKVYSTPCTSEIVVFHDAVGYLPGWYSRLFSTDRLPSGLYTPYAAASVTGWLFYERGKLPIQHYPVFKSCWASGSRFLNTKGNAFENESAPGPIDFNNPPPQSDWQVECAARVEHDIAVFKGWPEGYWRRPVDANDLTATEYEHNETVRFGGLYSSCPNGRIRWDNIAAIIDEKENDMFLIRAPDGGCYIVGPLGKRHLRSMSELGAYWKLLGKPIDVTQTEADAIPTMSLSA